MEARNLHVFCMSGTDLVCSVGASASELSQKFVKGALWLVGHSDLAHTQARFQTGSCLLDPAILQEITQHRFFFGGGFAPCQRRIQDTWKPQYSRVEKKLDCLILITLLPRLTFFSPTDLINSEVFQKQRKEKDKLLRSFP